MDARAELLGGLLQPDGRALVVDLPLAQQQHKLLAEEGQPCDWDCRLVRVQRGLAVNQGTDGHVAQEELVDGGLDARRPSPDELRLARPLHHAQALADAHHVVETALLPVWERGLRAWAVGRGARTGGVGRSPGAQIECRAFTSGQTEVHERGLVGGLAVLKTRTHAVEGDMQWWGSGRYCEGGGGMCTTCAPARRRGR